MKRIDIVDGILYYYGNPVGCVSGETAILDTMFQKEELIRFLTEKGIENPVFRGGVYDQLSEDSGTEKTITIDRKEPKKFRIYQLGQKSPVTMRFISLAERRKRGYDRPHGLFVSMPSYKAGNEYKDICFPITQECRKQLHDAVIGAYEQAIAQGQDTVAKHHEMQAPEGQAIEMSGM